MFRIYLAMDAEMKKIDLKDDRNPIIEFYDIQREWWMFSHFMRNLNDLCQIHQILNDLFSKNDLTSFWKLVKRKGFIAFSFLIDKIQTNNIFDYIISSGIFKCFDIQ